MCISHYIIDIRDRPSGAVRERSLRDGDSVPRRLFVLAIRAHVFGTLLLYPPGEAARARTLHGVYRKFDVAFRT